MDAINCIESRRTLPTLAEGPAPSAEQLATILKAGTMAPDHKMLRPWRFIVVRGENRTVLSEHLGQAALNSNPNIEPDVLKKAKGKHLRSPVSIVVIAAPKIGKAPLWEQHASAAAATQNMCLAAHALGLASAWKSSPLMEEEPVRTLLGMGPGEMCLGWIELGMINPEFRPKARPPIALQEICLELSGSRLDSYKDL